MILSLGISKLIIDRIKLFLYFVLPEQFWKMRENRLYEMRLARALEGSAIPWAAGMNTRATLSWAWAYGVNQALGM